MQAIS